MYSWVLKPWINNWLSGYRKIELIERSPESPVELARRERPAAWPGQSGDPSLLRWVLGQLTAEQISENFIQRQLWILLKSWSIDKSLTFILRLTQFGIKDSEMSTQITPIEVINWGMTTPTPMMVCNQTDHLIFAFREISQYCCFRTWAST